MNNGIYKMSINLKSLLEADAKAKVHKSPKELEARSRIERANLGDELRRIFSYDPDDGLLRWKVDRSKKVKKGMVAGTMVLGYMRVGLRLSVGRRYIQSHTLSWFLHYGKWPVERIDHINGDRADNRIHNLRDVNKWENNSNLKIHRDGRLPGFRYIKASNNYQSQIQVDKKRISLGYFDTEAEAHAAYRGARLVIDKFYQPLKLHELLGDK
jgi:hypothetical protein